MSQAALGVTMDLIGEASLVVVGIGVNLGSAPEATKVEPGAVPPVRLEGVTPAQLLPPLCTRFAQWNARLSGEGFAPLRNAWLARAARVGTQITARLPGRTLTGRFETVDAEGALVLDIPTGRVHLPAAEVFF